MRDLLKAKVLTSVTRLVTGIQKWRRLSSVLITIHIIDLELTVPALDSLIAIVRVMLKQEQGIIRHFRRAAAKIVKEQAERAGQPFVNHRWLGGMLTNWKTIRQSIKRLKRTRSEDERWHTR